MWDPYNNADNPYDRSYAGKSPLPSKAPGSDALATAAMVMGILAAMTSVGLMFHFAFIFGSIGIVMALLSKGRASRLATRARAGIIGAVIGIAVSAVVCGTTVVMLYTNPELMEQAMEHINETFEKQYGISYEELMDTLLNGGELPYE